MQHYTNNQCHSFFDGGIVSLVCSTWL